MSPAGLIRDLILSEIEVPIPHTVSGRNKIVYNKDDDRFGWFVELDNGQMVEILQSVSSEYLEDLLAVIDKGLSERARFIGKVKKDSVSVPSNILRRLK